MVLTWCGQVGDMIDQLGKGTHWDSLWLDIETNPSTGTVDATKATTRLRCTALLLAVAGSLVILLVDETEHIPGQAADGAQTWPQTVPTSPRCWTPHRAWGLVQASTQARWVGYWWSCLV